MIYRCMTKLMHLLYRNQDRTRIGIIRFSKASKISDQLKSDPIALIYCRIQIQYLHIKSNHKNQFYSRIQEHLLPFHQSKQKRKFKH